MASHTIGIIVNGATGRIGSTQHLANALIPIIDEGGLALGDDRLVPHLLLAGRDAARLAAVARAHKLADWTTDLDAALADPAYAIFFDAAATQGRVAVLEKAIAAGKHVYCEKPLAPAAAQGLALLREARRRGVKHGVVEDKIHLPGLQKLAALTRGGALGRVVGFQALPAAELELSRRRRRHYSGYVPALALRHRKHRRPHRAGGVERVDRHARARRRAGRALRRRGRGFGRDPGRGRGRRLRHHRELVGDAGAPRRPSHAAGRWQQGLGGRGPASMPRAVDGAHAGDRPFQRDARHRRRLPQRMDRSAAARGLLQPLPRGLGSIPAACGGRRAARVRLRGRHSRRRVRGRLPSQHAGADLDRVAAGGAARRGGPVAGTHIPEAGDHGFPPTRERQQVTPRRRTCRSRHSRAA